MQEINNINNNPFNKITTNISSKKITNEDNLNNKINENINISEEKLKSNLNYKDLKEGLDILNKVPLFDKKINFSIHEEKPDLLVIKIKDNKDNLIVQYPAEDFIKQMIYSKEQIFKIFDKII